MINRSRNLEKYLELCPNLWYVREWSKVYPVRDRVRQNIESIAVIAVICGADHKLSNF